MAHFFKDGRELRWGCFVEFRGIPEIAGRLLPCDRLWRKALAEKSNGNATSGYPTGDLGLGQGGPWMH